jgi:toxin-antitoxin system PIN domain toxin
MLLMDTNVLVNAHRVDSVRHKEYQAWLEAIINGPEPYAVCDFAVTAMIRITTDRRIYDPPSTTAEAVTFADQIRNQPHALVVAPGPRFWSIFTELCEATGARAKLVPDAYLAALAIENACEFITDDNDFSKFPGLRWRHPLN